MRPPLGCLRFSRRLKDANAYDVEGIVIEVTKESDPVRMVSTHGIGVFNGDDSLIVIYDEHNMRALGQTLFHTVEMAGGGTFGGANRIRNVSGNGDVLG